jgi:hypothetical protein
MIKNCAGKMNDSMVFDCTMAGYYAIKQDAIFYFNQQELIFKRIDITLICRYGRFK